MAVVNRVIKPKTRRGKRALQKREPKAVENRKTALFIKGKNCSKLLMDCMKDLDRLKRPATVSYNRKNDIRPFEDFSKLEWYGKKNDASLFMFGSHNKKRPHNMVIGRLYDYQMLDMIELGVENYVALSEFKNSKIAASTKPCLLFAGEEFSNVGNIEMQRLKNLLIDFFRGPEVEQVRLAGIEHAIQFTSLGEDKVLLRSYKILMKKSGQRTPRIELEEIGPSLDLKLRRTHIASQDLYKTACKQFKYARTEKTVKNISEDVFGTKLGRLHVPPQNITDIQTRKVRALKESKEERTAKIAKETEERRRQEIEAVFGSGDEMEGPDGDGSGASGDEMDDEDES